jgi:S-disulfanyl-L-cysteine oxidoreductase SoxD
MFMPKLRMRNVAALILSGVVLAACGATPVNDAGHVRLGQPISEANLQGWDLIVEPDGGGLPSGSGTAAQGQLVYDQQCAACHGQQGEGVPGVPKLVGGSTTSTPPNLTVGSYWPYASTVFDYVRRAMPPTTPKSLSNDEVYQVVAYLLSMNGIVEDDFVLDKNSFREVQMPNRDGFIDRSEVQ